MKPIFTFLPTAICFLLFFTSCKKDAVDPANGGLGTISGNIDGSSKKFNTSAKAVQVSTQNSYEIKIEGYEQTGSLNNIEITIVSPNPIVPGTYANDISTNLYVHIVHYSGITLFGTRYDSWEQVGSLRLTGSVTISEINSSSVKGSFNATLFYSTFTGTDLTKPLSNGFFNVSF